jgi:hypothetical protein
MRSLRTAPALAAALALAIVASGCGYTLRPPYDPSIRTVYVPIFRSNTFRKDLNLELHRAVIYEIERRSTYKVVDDPEGADAILSGLVTFADKIVLVEDPNNNLPQHLYATMNAQVTLEDNRPGADRSKEPPTVVVNEMISFYPELGETAQLGFQRAIDRMAQQIVGMMESPW